MIKAFPKIFAVGTDYIIDIFKEPVEITEKIDGSQFVFGKIDGSLYIRSKGKEIFVESVDNLFKEGVDYITSIEDKIPDNTVFYCEYLKKPRHNILEYSRIPKNHLILFGASNGKDSFIKDFQKYADILDIECVPVLDTRTIRDPQEIQEFMEKESILGGPNAEGVVVKNYDRPFLLGGQPIPLMCGKYVSEKFKEVHREKWPKEHTGRGKWQLFIDSFRTEARWEKAIQHLEESGELEHEPKDIGKLLKEVKRDIAEEEKEEIVKFLWREFGEDVLRRSVQGLPEWYKERLLKRSFEKEA